MSERPGTGLSVDENGQLICTCLVTHPISWRLLSLRGDEFCLNRGRFQAFRLQPQTHAVTVVANGATKFVQWIVEQGQQSLWSMTGIARPDLALVFSFSDPMLAALFALRWR